MSLRVICPSEIIIIYYFYFHLTCIIMFPLHGKGLVQLINIIIIKLNNYD